jgi:hypothetical protein
MNSAVYALCANGNDLYAAGYFSTAGGVSANCIAKWNGSTWTALGTGMNSYVNTLTMYGSSLVAGGALPLRDAIKTVRARGRYMIDMRGISLLQIETTTQA